jgi:cytochrome oxidase Cu insertion factor (SCO1/SenC/PrrC family)
MHVKGVMMRKILLLIGTLLLTACGANTPAATPTSAPTAPPADAPSSAAALNVGDNAPAFDLPSAQGGRAALSDYAGRPVLLYFHMAVG